MPFTLEHVEDPPGVEFRERPNQLGRMAATQVRDADAEALADYLDRRFGLPGAGTVEERLVAAIGAMTESGEISTYCRRAGVAYRMVWFDGERWRPSRRRLPLFRATEPSGFLRVLSLELSEKGDILLDEEFTDPAAPRPDDIYSAYGYGLSLTSGQFAALRLGDRAETAFPALIERGDLGAHLPPGGNREWLAARCAAAGFRPDRRETNRRHRILRAGPLDLTVQFWDNWQSTVEFVEAYRVGAHDRYGGTEYRVSAPLESVPVLAARFEERLGRPPAPGRAADRLIACFDALAADGHLGAELARQGNRRVVAEWMTEAGVTPALKGFARTEQLLKVHREATDCVYQLTLTMDAEAAGNDGVKFFEKYEYLPHPGDAGREYGYGVRTPYSSLAALVAHLETEPGEGDLEERLTRSFTALSLTGDLGLQEARERVASMFERAGVPVERTDSSWVNTDWD